MIDSLLSGSVEGFRRPASERPRFALFSVLQTNAVASLLPDAFRWVQVLRKRSGLSKEEEAELRYLRSPRSKPTITHPRTSVAELNQLKMDLTGRYARNEHQDGHPKLTLIDARSHHLQMNCTTSPSPMLISASGSLDSSQRMHLPQEESARVPSSMHQNMDTDPLGQASRKGA